MTINITLEEHQLATILEALQALEDHHRERQHAALQARDKETARDHRSEANQAESVRSHLEELHLEATGKPLKGAHNALIDVLATRRIFFSPKFRAYLASYRHELEPDSIAMQILFDHITTTS